MLFRYLYKKRSILPTTMCMVMAALSFTNCHVGGNRGKNPIDLAVFMIMLSLTQALTSYKVGFMDRFCQMPGMQILGCVIKGVFSFSNYFIHWSYGLHRVHHTNMIAGVSIAGIIREVTMFEQWNKVSTFSGMIFNCAMLMTNIIINLTSQLSLSDVTYIVAPKLAYVASNRFYLKNSHGNILDESVLISLMGMLVGLMSLLYFYIKGVAEKDKDGNDIEGTVSVKRVFKSAMSPWSLLGIYTKSEARIFENWVNYNIGEDYCFFLDKMGNLLHLISISSHEKAEGNMVECAGLAFKPTIVNIIHQATESNHINTVSFLLTTSLMGISVTLFVWMMISAKRDTGKYGRVAALAVIRSIFWSM